tara:strand:- start:555 stop:698 length:144 start_codon:yes stop_codon:yes gene_type:complete
MVENNQQNKILFLGQVKNREKTKSYPELKVHTKGEKDIYEIKKGDLF